jgi:NAD(P)-dependent dehydrogenase (short-subunit alcohol dehydrogenase family)
MRVANGYTYATRFCAILPKPAMHRSPVRDPGCRERRKYVIQEFRGKVAVITGAASGMGRAFAWRLAHEGMKVVLADIDSALERTTAELRAAEHEVMSVRTDVSDPAAVEHLAERALEAYGKVHLLSNNAGVSALNGGPWMPIWRASLKDWQWITNVNYWGVAHGIRVLVPIMLAQDEEGHIVNTASIAGLMPASGVYGATKHAVVSMSESLFRDTFLHTPS